MLRIRTLVALLALLPTLAMGQIPAANPLVDAAQRIGTKGLGDALVTDPSVTAFKPTGGRIYVKEYVAALTAKPDERSALETSILATIEGYEKVATSIKQPNDPATALAFSVAVLDSIVHKADPDDAAFLALAPRFRAIFSKAAATDRQKQQFYEWSLASSGMVAALLSATTDPTAKAKIGELAKTQLVALIGAKSAAIHLKGSSVSIEGTAPAVATEGSKPVASALSYSFPSDWRKDGVWTIADTKESGPVSSAQIRLVPAVPAKGSFSDALREAWKKYVPEEFRDFASGMAFRRYVGDGLVAHFVCASAPEKGRKWDTLFSVYLVDCGATWQPIVVAQTWLDPRDRDPIGAEMTARFSFSKSAPFVETFFKTLSAPGAKGGQLIDKSALIGEFNYGNTSTLQWQNIYSGATSMSVVSFGGTLSLKADGSFAETYSSASGQVGNLGFYNAKGKGTWSIQGDLLVLKYLAYNQGDGYHREEKRYRIAGVVVFTDGQKVVVLKSKTNEPVNALTVGDRSEYFSTTKKE